MFAMRALMRYLRAMIVDHNISEGFVVAVKPETDIRFLRERAWTVIRYRRALGLPVGIREIRDQLPHLVVPGGKRNVRAPYAVRPSAA